MSNIIISEEEKLRAIVHDEVSELLLTLARSARRKKLSR